LAQEEGTNPECLGSTCGRPLEEGGGCGCGCGCSVWVAYTDDGDTLSYTDDADGDGRADDRDNCPFVTNRYQEDVDGDAVGDVCDNCGALSNLNQLDTNGDGEGDVCDADDDGDTYADTADNCAAIPNQSQSNIDGDALGDACDLDDDADGYDDVVDTCPQIANVDQGTIPDPLLCKTDTDGDSVGNGYDNCVDAYNPDQKDTDLDGIGDACDADVDNDGVLNEKDNCTDMANPDQRDNDSDLKGDACDYKYCFVVDPASPQDCLDPLMPFTVSGGGTVIARQDNPFRPAIFANRNGQGIEYTWTVTQRPAGSRAAVENPHGAVALSRNWQYMYVDGQVPSFTPDKPGHYELQLAAKLMFPDPVYPTQTESFSTLKLEVQSSSIFACGAVPAGPLAMLALGVLGFLQALRRRR
jgi:uncharacterized protein (TIGR03382 family)